jgi:hypothetical protein
LVVIVTFALTAAVARAQVPAAVPDGAQPPLPPTDGGVLPAAPVLGAENQAGPSNAAPPRPISSAPPPGVPEDGESPLLTGGTTHPAGTGVGFRVGWSFGGDTLAGATLSDGSEESLDAGRAVSFEALVMVTPFWRRKKLGLGFGFSGGWAGGEIAASNGSIALRRIPFEGTVHLLARLGRHTYVLFGAGLHKDADLQLRASGLFGMGRADLSSGLGAVAQLGLYLAFNRHVAGLLMARGTAVSYSVGDTDIDASNIGVSFGLFLNL